MKVVKRLVKEEEALVIIESAIVFPIIFFTVAFLIFLGNALHEKAKIDSIVMRAAIRGAASIADPYHSQLTEKKVDSDNSQFPTEYKFFKDTQPYRYLLGVGGIEKDIEEAVIADINNRDTRFFKYEINNPPVVNAKFNNHVINMSFQVEAEFNYELPFEFAGMSMPPLTVISSRAEVAVSDCDEFIRNTDMAIDTIKYLKDETKIGQTVTEKFSKVKDFFNKFRDK